MSWADQVLSCSLKNYHTPAIQSQWGAGGGGEMSCDDAGLSPETDVTQHTFPTKHFDPRKNVKCPSA